MRIGIDANWAIYEKAGIGKYTQNLIKALLEFDQKNEYVLFFNFFKKPRERMKEISEIVENAKAKVEIDVSVFPAKLKEILTQTSLPMRYLIRKDIDIFHSPFFSGIPKVGLPKMVATIHDLAFVYFPEHKGKKISNYYLKRTKYCLKNTKKIIAVSKSTKEDLINVLAAEEKKIEVVYEGVDKKFKPRTKKEYDKIVKKYIPKGQDFFLSVCTLEPRKNLSRLIEAYSILPFDVQRKYRLVLVGSAGWNNQELYRTIDNLNLKNKVILTGFVPDVDLPYLYNAAKMFIYPSLYEGFGLPVLEAMASGATVITSNTSSLPEITSNAALLVDVNSYENIALAIKKVLSSEKFQIRLKKRGIKQAKKFTWEKTAKDTIKVYEKVFKIK